MIKPVNNYLLVEYEEPKETTKGGLYVPQGSNTNATDILIKGKVLGKGSNVDKVEVEEGEYILYNKHAFTKIPEQKGIVLVRQEDVYAVI